MRLREIMQTGLPQEEGGEKGPVGGAAHKKRGFLKRMPREKETGWS